MSLRFGAAASAAVLAAFLLAAEAKAADVPPSLKVENASLEVGPVTAGTAAEAIFVFRNEGERDVRILRAAPS